MEALFQVGGVGRRVSPRVIFFMISREAAQKVRVLQKAHYQRKSFPSILVLKFCASVDVGLALLF